jgi:hypothetical protein
MAGRSLRSKRVLADESEGESEFLHWPCGQLSNSNELSDSPADKESGVVEEMVGENMALGEDSAGRVQEEIEQTASSNKEGDNVNASGAQTVLLAFIWRSLQEDRERNEKNRKLDQENWEKIR